MLHLILPIALGLNIGPKIQGYDVGKLSQKIEPTHEHTIVAYEHPSFGWMQMGSFDRAEPIIIKGTEQRTAMQTQGSAHVNRQKHNWEFFRFKKKLTRAEAKRVAKSVGGVLVLAVPKKTTEQGIVASGEGTLENKLRAKGIWLPEKIIPKEFKSRKPFE